jgi:hypothetical protein
MRTAIFRALLAGAVILSSPVVFSGVAWAPANEQKPQPYGAYPCSSTNPVGTNPGSCTGYPSGVR